MNHHRLVALYENREKIRAATTQKELKKLMARLNDISFSDTFAQLSMYYATLYKKSPQAHQTVLATPANKYSANEHMPVETYLFRRASKTTQQRIRCAWCRKRTMRMCCKCDRGLCNPGDYPCWFLYHNICSSPSKDDLITVTQNACKEFSGTLPSFHPHAQTKDPLFEAPNPHHWFKVYR